MIFGATNWDLIGRKEVPKQQGKGNGSRAWLAASCKAGGCSPHPPGRYSQLCGPCELLETRAALLRMLQLSSAWSPTCLCLYSCVLLREMLSSDSQDSFHYWSSSVVLQGPRHLSDVMDRGVQAANWLVTTQQNVYTGGRETRSYQAPCV